MSPMYERRLGIAVVFIAVMVSPLVVECRLTTVCEVSLTLCYCRLCGYSLWHLNNRFLMMYDEGICFVFSFSCRWGIKIVSFLVIFKIFDIFLSHFIGSIASYQGPHVEATCGTNVLLCVIRLC